MLLLGLLVSTSAYQVSYAQVNVQVNIGSQPIWGPTGYDYVDYYYLPDLDIYYYVPLQQWIYYAGGRWIPTTNLPPQYSQYNLYQLHKVVINENQPYLRNATYRQRYASFKGRHDQPVIRDSRDARYAVNTNRPPASQASLPTRNGQPVRATSPPAQRGNGMPNGRPGAVLQPGGGSNRTASPQGGRAAQQPNQRGGQGGHPGNR